MRKQMTVCLIVMLALLAGGQPTAAQDVVSDLLGRINGLRASLGLVGYTFNGALAAAAQSQAQWIVDTGIISHTRPDGSTPTSRAAAAGYGSRWVSENIYGGSLATPNDAWNFWVNSAVHYRGLTNPNYSELGIGAAQSSWGQAYVLVFGNPGDSWSAGGGGTGGGGRVAAAPPVFIVGVDAVGNLMHEIQPSDTIGDIALLYGYTWDDLPYLLQINNMTQEQVRLLPIGGIFLVPPHAGTYTPSPLPANVTLTFTPEPPTLTPTPITPTATLDFNQRVLTALVQTQVLTQPQTNANTPAPSPSNIEQASTPSRIITSDDVPASLLNVQPSTPIPIDTAITIAQANTDNTDSANPTAPDLTAGVIVQDNPTSPILVVAMVLQTLVIAAASAAFIRQMRR